MQLHIPTPCQESWAAMTPAGNGRHCAACRHLVIDFTRMTDGEIVAYLASQAGHRVCGRLDKGQIGRELVPALPIKESTGWWNWARVSAAASALWLLLSGLGSHKAFAQTRSSQHSQIQTKRTKTSANKTEEKAQPSKLEDVQIMLGKIREAPSNLEVTSNNLTGIIAAPTSEEKQRTAANQTEYRVVEQMPEAPYNYEIFIANHLKYPKLALDSGVAGKVYISFRVNTDSTISNIRILKGIGYGCDEEAVRIISLLPKWVPGKQSGKAVPVRVQLPVQFILPK